MDVSKDIQLNKQQGVTLVNTTVEVRYLDNNDIVHLQQFLGNVSSLPVSFTTSYEGDFRWLITSTYLFDGVSANGSVAFINTMRETPAEELPSTPTPPSSCTFDRTDSFNPGGLDTSFNVDFTGNLLINAFASSGITSEGQALFDFKISVNNVEILSFLDLRSNIYGTINVTNGDLITTKIIQLNEISDSFIQWKCVPNPVTTVIQ